VDGTDVAWAAAVCVPEACVAGACVGAWVADVGELEADADEALVVAG